MLNVPLSLSVMLVAIGALVRALLNCRRCSVFRHEGLAKQVAAVLKKKDAEPR
jgi:hypothetical protein